MLDYRIRLYYIAKRVIPRTVQVAVRSKLAMRKWRNCANSWPIYEPCALPEGWAGWPEGKKFSLVLTHDVETKAGVEKVLKLADLEESLGFRSAFNFVAEEYGVPMRIFEELRARGFEIGVHGLYHNSSLYHSRREFLKQARRINQVLKEWNAVGFRSPCMYHNLEWLHDLDIEYDASTFDIDPFEPQPDGMHTIFPFYIKNGVKEDGYLELPYTLSQDFTIFVLMRNRTIDIWKKKLDWIVRKGGMALLVTHPDYMRFPGDKWSYGQYDIGYYKEFLMHIRSEYWGRFWNALPREIARSWKGLTGKSPDARERTAVLPLKEEPPRTRKNICMLAYTFYEEDGRVRRYAEALAQRGDRVDVVALKQNDLPDYELMNGVNVYRIQRRIINEKNKFSYLSRLMKFLGRSTTFISKKHLGSNYDLVHVHSVPDFEVFAAFLPKVTGAKVILDIHDIVPEFYAAKFKVDTNCLAYKALLFLEKICVKFSDHLIISNHLWEKKLTGRSARPGKCSTLLNYPDRLFFKAGSGTRKRGKPIMIYPGTLNWHQGLDIAIEAFSMARSELAEWEFHIYGEGQEKPALRSLVAELGLERSILFRDSLPLDAIGNKMAEASIGIVPKRNDPFGGEAFSTKVFEFMALEVPVILSKTKIDSYYFNDSLVQFFEPGNVENLAECMVLLSKDREKRDFLAGNARKYINDLCWEERKKDYLALVDGLLAGGGQHKFRVTFPVP